jgi:hypothetical protein
MSILKILISNILRVAAFAAIAYLGLAVDLRCRASTDVRYVYDSLNRIVEVHYIDRVIHYTYDDAGNRTGTTVELLAAPPAISGLNPTSVIAGAPGFTLNIHGSNFTNNAIVKWNGIARPTIFVDSGQVQINVPPDDIGLTGVASVVVENPTIPAVSNSFSFTILAQPSQTPSPTPTPSVTPSPSPTPPLGPLVTISGRVLSPTGFGLRNVVVTITDTDGVRRSTPTSSLGFYTFDEVVPGRHYVLAAQSRRYRFMAVQLFVTAGRNDINFFGLE